jgi:hypothetical protein
MDPGVYDFDHVMLPEQLSVAVGSVHETVALQDSLDVYAVMLDGQFTMTGFWLSVTIMLKLQVLLIFPATSVTV